MTSAQSITMTAHQAATFLAERLAQANCESQGPDLDNAIEAYVQCLGLALQLGPAPTQQVLLETLTTMQHMIARQNAAGLSAIGPALVDVVNQVRVADALPQSAIMDAWATIASDIGAIIGQAGLALALPHDHRQGMRTNILERADHLDNATSGLFHLADRFNNL